ncbi:hypothetical protein N780_07780 [Pontibacillus chungwhensis BH030062]|uniref:Uncharacterized protein n=1 Tax=Pontibacillus chungwhensis BH030062 TaxID=1385513 RepID=A0A0A2UTB8_9BACI|nr:hypothetical protein [Pontibacillus chungwhensis]KGP89993.1 hypothetical protein N780_07780 [Pontibacillus chungwhensis BH030062]
MLFSRWTLWQTILIGMLGMLAFVAEQFNQVIAVPMISSHAHSLLPAILTILFLALIVGIFSLIIRLELKKNPTIFTSRFWDKAPLILIIFLVLSLVLYITGFMMDPFRDLLQRYRLSLYLILYYFLLLVNLLVLATVQKVKGNTISGEKKIGMSFFGTMLFLVVTIFII